MGPVRILSIEEKLFRLGGNAEFIENIVSKNTDKQILSERPLYYSIQHMIFLSIELILDIGNHILSEKFSEKPSRYSDIIVSLGKHKIIDEDFAATQKEMAKFRNLLAHEYASLDENKVVQYAREAVPIFKLFIKYFADFLETDKPFNQ